MAFVPAGVQAMNVTFEDRDKNTGTVAFFVPAAVITADVDTFATTTLPTILAPLSDAFIRRISIQRTWENDTYVQPVEAADVERKGVFVWSALDRTISKNEIPSIKNTLVLDGTNTINTTDAAIVAFIAMMVDTGLLDVYGLGNYRGIKLTGTKTAPRKIHRASSKG